VIGKRQRAWAALASRKDGAARKAKVYRLVAWVFIRLGVFPIAYQLLYCLDHLANLESATNPDGRLDLVDTRFPPVFPN
jgi:hypothetical protein